MSASASTTWPRLSDKPRRLFLIGCAMLLLGACAVAFPHIFPLVIGAFAGWLLWLAGAIMFGASLLMRGARPYLPGLVSSLVAIGAGVFLLLNPRAGALAVAILAGTAFITDGAFQLALALDLRPHRAWRWVLASAMTSFVAVAVIALAGRAGSPELFGRMVGLAILSTGIAFVAISDNAKRFSERPRSS